MLSSGEYLQIIIAIVAIFSPFSAIPIFISLTSAYNQAERISTAKLTATSAGIAGLVSIWIGQYVLMFFNISIPAFKIAGGILVLIMSINMINAQVPKAKSTQNELEEAKSNSREIAVVPLAIPLIAGPGAISTIIIYSQKIDSFMHLCIMSLIIVAISFYIWFVLRISNIINEKIGITGINIISRVMGLLLASISIEFLISGLSEVFPALLQSGK